MSNLIEKIMAMEAGGGNDALIFQAKSGGNGAPNYNTADGIIRRIRIPDGSFQWAFHTISHMPHPVTGSGIYGDINEVVRAVEKQFGVSSDIREWIGVDYCDSDFPSNFIP